MPKKFVGENTKAVTARAKKNAAKEEEAFRKEKQKEDEYWQDDDKQINKKKERKELQEKKRQEQLQRKSDNKSLIEQEEASNTTLSKQPIAKITKAQIQAEKEKREAAIAAALESVKKKENATHVEKPLEENVNHIVDDAIEARGVSEAIAVLTINGQGVDKHPEKRQKAAFAAYEAANMQRIKDENPSLRLTQLKQILFKDWNKSPDNPINQRRADV